MGFGVSGAGFGVVRWQRRQRGAHHRDSPHLVQELRVQEFKVQELKVQESGSMV